MTTNHTPTATAELCVYGQNGKPVSSKWIARVNGIVLCNRGRIRRFATQHTALEAALREMYSGTAAR